MPSYSDFQRDVIDEKPQVYQGALLRYILDAQVLLRTRLDVDLQQMVALIEEIPCVHHITLYLQQDHSFYRIRQAASQEESYLWQYPIPATIFTQLQPFQDHSQQAYILPVSTVQDRIPALLPSLVIGDSQHPPDQSMQTIVLIPLLTWASPQGFLTLVSPIYDPRSGHDETIDLLTLFAQQLAMYLERIQYQRELRRVEEERLALTKIRYSLLEPEALYNLQSVYLTIYTQLKAFMPLDFFAVERYDQQQGKVLQDFQIEFGEILPLPANRELPPLFLNYLLEEQPATIMYSTTGEWRHPQNSLLSEIFSYMQAHMPLRSGNIVRSGITIILKYADEPYGILTILSYQERSYTQQHLSMLSIIGAQIATALKSASMYSELRRALQVAQESEQLKDQFLMTASHELRTPLTAVQGYLELLHTFNNTLSEETKNQFLNNAHRACEELVLLLGNIMDASRINQDKVEMTLGSVHLIESVHTIVEIMEPLFLREARYVEVHVPDELSIVADDLRLRQVLLNLVGNAFKYAPTSHSIAIRAESLTLDQLTQRSPAAQQASALSEIQRYVVIAIRDWGPGIALEDQSRLFTKFIRLNSAINSTERGAGLGLYLCRQLIEAMHGFIWLESCGIPGEGATFFVALPQSQQS